MRNRARSFAGLAIALAAAAALAQTGPEPSRGKLLYATHCLSCHTTEVHWREKHQATNWKSLQAQVRRWQGAVGLQWSDADVNEVARHLNDTIYHFARPVQQARR